jgi:predicted nucleic acid-binding protein
MKWLLDTNVLSESVRSSADPRLLTWMAARSREQLAISIVTLAELRNGMTMIADDVRRASYSRWIDDELKTSFGDRLLPLTLEILTDWLSLARRLELRGRPRSAPDLMIAATARVHDLILVSRNAKDFTGTDVILYDPWSGNTQHMGVL